MQAADALKCFLEVGDKSVAWGNAQRRDATGPNQLGRDQEQSLSQALESSALQMSWSTKALEPVQQVVGQQHDLEEHLVGREVLGRNLAQRIGVFQLADD